MRIVRFTFTVICGVLLLAVCAAAVALVAVPKVVGGMSLTVLSGSMKPGIKPGDIVVTRGVTELNQNTFRAGDIITFLPYANDPTLVTHRIVSVQSHNDGTVSYVTKGDAIDNVDPWGPVAASHVRGLVMYWVPGVGYIRAWVGDNAGKAVFVAAIGLIAYGVVVFALSFKKPKTQTAPQRAEEQLDETQELAETQELLDEGAQ